MMMIMQGLSLGNRLGPSSVWLAADGSLKISTVVHLEINSREVRPLTPGQQKPFHQSRQMERIP